MNPAHIVHVETHSPEYSRSTSEILPYMEEWMEALEDRSIRKMKKIFEGAGVDRRYGIMDIAEVFRPTSFEDKNHLFQEATLRMSRETLGKSLESTGWDPASIDMIVTVSCTGFMIPSLDAYLINDFGINPAVVRLPVTEMGCVAGISGLIYAYNYIKGNPGSRAVVIAAECPTATFQHSDYSMANIVSAALFGDGCACVCLSSREEDRKGAEIKGAGMYHFPDTTRLMGFDLTNQGLKMVLDPEVPLKIEEHFERIVFPFLEELGVGIDEIDRLVFHPGGRKIVERTEALFGAYGKNLDETRATLKEYGNMSSATVLFVLDRVMHSGVAPGEKGLLLSFGPGFSAQRMLVEWT